MTYQAAPRRRIAPWVLALVGFAMIAFPFAGGFRALQAIGVPVASDPATLGGIALELGRFGLLILIVGLGLALRATPAWLIGIGAMLLFLGTGPLVVVGLMAQLKFSADPNPNPVGFGMLAAFTLPAALVLLIWGILARAKRRRQ